MSEIETALRNTLPADLQAQTPAFARILSDVASRALTLEDAEARLATEFAPQLQALAGQQIQTSNTLISFGSDSNQSGATITIEDVAGRDGFKNITIILKVPGVRIISTQGGDYAEGNLDKWEGVFVSGGNVQGPAIGKNEGTVNVSYTYTSSSHPSPLTAQQQRNRSQMLDKVEHDWIKGVLDQSLYQIARIELGLEQAPEKVGHPWESVIHQGNHQPSPLPAGKPVIELFDEFLGTLLILGMPGGGKTTMLLELARDLIARARLNSSILFLSSSISPPGQPSDNRWHYGSRRN